MLLANMNQVDDNGKLIMGLINRTVATDGAQTRKQATHNHLENIKAHNTTLSSIGALKNDIKKDEPTLPKSAVVIEV